MHAAPYFLQLLNSLQICTVAQQLPRHQGAAIQCCFSDTQSMYCAHSACLFSCRFTLAALENSDKAEAQRAQALVRRYGGRRFTSQTLHLLQGVDKSSVLALCPCSLPKHKITQLQPWGDFTSGAARICGF